MAQRGTRKVQDNAVRLDDAGIALRVDAAESAANCQLNFLWNRAAITEAVLGPQRAEAA